MEGINHVVFYGLQGAIQEITENFEQYFFGRDIEEIIAEYKETAADVFGRTNPEFANNIDTAHIRNLHNLGYLPLKIKALKEGTFTPIGVPMFTVENTLPEFFWLPSFLESQLSSYIWAPMTAATIADKVKQTLLSYADLTGDRTKLMTQASDFSLRGMASPEAAMRTSGGHLLSFGASSTVQAKDYLMRYYDAKPDTLNGTLSTEHSVMCCHGEDEYNAYKFLTQNVHRSGTISIVSDTYDFWNVIDNVLPLFREEMLRRDGKVVVRPDSGDPVDIICGDPLSEDETVRKGLIERLYEIFGGTINEKGYIELSPKIGAVYADAITPERTQKICERLMDKGFATTNVNLGIGSYTYQYNTRDTFGFALKSTAEIQDGEFKMIQKRPATDKDSFKKSGKGMVAAVERDGDLALIDGLTPEQEAALADINLLENFYVNGELVKPNNFEDIRARVASESTRVYGWQNINPQNNQYDERRF
jgi:nicotinamide phosphoribosyltransferase